MQANRKWPIKSDQCSLDRQDRTKRPLEEGCGPLSGQMVSSKECGSVLRPRRGEQSSCWKKQRKSCSWRHTAAGKMSRCTRRSLSPCESVGRLLNASSVPGRNSGRLGGSVLKNDKLNAWSSAKLRGGARRRRAEEQFAADSAEEHGLLEADDRARRSYVCPHCRRYPLQNFI